MLKGHKEVATNQLYLASYLKSKGVKFKGIEPQEKGVLNFIFYIEEGDSESLKILDEWKDMKKEDYKNAYNLLSSCSDLKYFIFMYNKNKEKSHG